jgi:hypothetical protein
METAFKKKAVRLALLSVGVMFIASFALPTHPGLANAQQNETLRTPKKSGLFAYTVIIYYRQ